MEIEATLESSMLWFEKHPNCALARLAAGLLDAPERSRVADHARTCGRCAGRYQQAVSIERTLAPGDPFMPSDTEVAALELGGLRTALASARGGQSVPWWRPALILVAASAAGLLMVFTGPLKPRPSSSTEGEFASRGAEVKAVHLRVFCAPPNGQLTEVVAGTTCPRGSTLAFAGGAAGGLGVAVVSIRAGGKDIQSPELPVRGALGSEVPLNFTPVLDLPEGPAELVAGFGATESEAREALVKGVQGPAGSAPSSTTVRRLDFVVGSAP